MKAGNHKYVKSAAGTKAVRRCVRNVVAITKQSGIEYACSFRGELCPEFFFQKVSPLIQPRHRKKHARIVEALDQQRTLDHAGRVKALAFEVFGEWRHARIAKVLFTIERGQHAN